MDLILWRHAEAHDPEGAQDDLERPLTSKGERHAQRMADWLNRQLPATTKLLASPARRCQQTAAALDRRFKTTDALSPGAGGEALLTAVRWPDAREPVLVVGHQPTLGLVAAWLLAAQAQPWAVRKGAVWWLRGRERNGEWQVLLHAMMAVEML
jgi:phosphohistidine phosphatase